MVNTVQVTGSLSEGELGGRVFALSVPFANGLRLCPMSTRQTDQTAFNIGQSIMPFVNSLVGALC